LALTPFEIYTRGHFNDCGAPTAVIRRAAGDPPGPTPKLSLQLVELGPGEDVELSKKIMDFIKHLIDPHFVY
jgi:hypothetical protein